MNITSEKREEEENIRWGAGEEEEDTESDRQEDIGRAEKADTFLPFHGTLCSHPRFEALDPAHTPQNTRRSVPFCD